MAAGEAGIVTFTNDAGFELAAADRRHAPGTRDALTARR